MPSLSRNSVPNRLHHILFSHPVWWHLFTLLEQLIMKRSVLQIWCINTKEGVAFRPFEDFVSIIYFFPYLGVCDFNMMNCYNGAQYLGERFSIGLSSISSRSASTTNLEVWMFYTGYSLHLGRTQCQHWTICSCGQSRWGVFLLLCKRIKE